MDVCSRCQTPLSDDDFICPRCGHPADMPAPAEAPQSKARFSIIARAAAKGLAKSLLISALIMGPGLVLLAQGMLLPGMLWLFVGSFGMMAWTYRKPWRLMWTSCLLPPLASVISYLVQLVLFGEAMPPFWLIIVAVCVGGLVGHARVQAHRVYEEGGTLFAQRTIGYLLVWVVAYGATQFFGLLGRNVFLVQGGLITGAFSTTMLVVVSYFLFGKLRASRAAVSAAAGFSLLWIAVPVLLFIGASESVAAHLYPDEVFDKIIGRDDNLRWPARGTLQEDTGSRLQVRDEYDATAGDHLSAHLRIYNRSGADDAFSLVAICVVSANDPNSTSVLSEQLSRMAGYIFDDPDLGSALRIVSKRARQRRQLTDLHQGYIESAFGREDGKSAAIATVHLAYNGWGILIFVGDGGPDRVSARQTTLDRFAEDLATAFAREIPNLQSVVTAPAQQPVEDIGFLSGDGGEPPVDPPEAGLPEPEQIASIAVAIATVLIAAGVGVQIANSIAAALAQALQSGVELTEKEVNDAILEGLAAEPIAEDELQREQEREAHDQETERILEEARREREAAAEQKFSEAESTPAPSRDTARQEAESEADRLLDDLLGEPEEAPEPEPTPVLAATEPPPAPDSVQEEAAAEANQKLDGLLGDDPAEETPAKEKKEPPFAIPAVPAALSDDRETPVDPDAGSEESQPKSDTAVPETSDPDGPRQSDPENPDAPGETTPDSSENTEEVDVPKSPAEPLRDPATGESLEVDPEGRIKYGDQWLPPEEAARKVQIDRDWQKQQRLGREKVDRMKATVEELKNTSDPEARQRLENELLRQVSGMNGDYAAKGILKAEGRNEISSEFDRVVHKVYDEVDRTVIDDMNEQGFRRGGRDFNREDFIEFRNAASAGTVGMDRDIGLNETGYREALEAYSKAEPGSPEAHAAAQRLAEARGRGKITLDPAQHDQYLADRRNQMIEEASALRGRLVELHRGSPEAEQVKGELARMEAEIKGLDQRRTDLDQRVERATALKQAKIEALEARRAKVDPDSPVAARIEERINRLRADGSIDVSPSRWNDMAQSSYNEAYTRSTQLSPEGALQVVTTGKHPEAFQDANVLKGIGPDNPPNPELAEQTASVSRVKEIENRHLAEAGHMTDGQAIQETARGYAKDMATKVTPLLENDPRVEPEKLERLRKIQSVLERAGRGEIPPGRVDGELQRAVPDIEGLTLGKATRIIDATFEAAIKWKKPPLADPNWGGKLASSLDVDQIQQDVNRMLKQGASVEDAVFVATAKALVGGKMGEIYNPGISMAGALTPEGARKIIPDQFAGELVEEGHKVFKGLVKDIAEGTVTGKIDLEHFRAAAEKAGDGKGVIADWMKAVRFLGEEAARADKDGSGDGAMKTISGMLGNLREDWNNVTTDFDDKLGPNEYQRQVGILNKRAGEYFGGELADESVQGKHGVPLQGYAKMGELAGEIMNDPAEFGRDLGRIWQNIGDPEMMKDTIEHTDKTLLQTPVAGTIYGGWKHLGDVITKSDKRSEAIEGAQALAGEVKDWMNASAASVGREIYSRFKR